MAETIETDNCYIWRETAPATTMGYMELLSLMQQVLVEKLFTPCWPQSPWRFRVLPCIEAVRDFELEVAYFQARLRLYR